MNVIAHVIIDDSFIRQVCSLSRRVSISLQGGWLGVVEGLYILYGVIKG